VYISSMCYGRKVFHQQECRFVKRIKKKNRLYFQDIAAARKGGFRFCNCCSPMTRKYRKERPKIKKIIEDNGLKVQVFDNTLLINNNGVNWKIVLSEDKTKAILLYHANTESNYGLKRVEGHLQFNYHYQRGTENLKCIKHLLEYIIAHDDWRMGTLNSYRTMSRKSKKKRKAYKRARRKARRIAATRVINLLEELDYEDRTRRI